MRLRDVIVSCLTGVEPAGVEPHRIRSLYRVRLRSLTPFPPGFFML